MKRIFNCFGNSWINKVITAALYLEQIGIPIPSQISVDRMYDLCMQISSGELRDLDKIASELEQIWQKEKQPKTYTVK